MAGGFALNSAPSQAEITEPLAIAASQLHWRWLTLGHRTDDQARKLHYDYMMAEAAMYSAAGDAASDISEKDMYAHIADHYRKRAEVFPE